MIDLLARLHVKRSQWPWWGQLVYFVCVPYVALAAYGATRPAGRRRPWFVGAAVLFGLVAIAAVSDGSPDEPEIDVAATDAPKASPAGERIGSPERIASPATSAPTPTTTQLLSPEGAFRSGDVDIVELELEDAVARSAVVYEDLALLDSLVVEPEHEAGYERRAFPHWDDADGDGCDTRCEVLTSQQQPDGSWFSAWDGTTEVDRSLVHIDHVVALAEAWRSGAHAWTLAQRDDFADDRRNLLAVTESSNLRKGDADASSWFPSNADANCLWARTVVHVKSAWQLSVDSAEQATLRNLLTSCGAVPPTTTTTTTAAPPPPPPPPPPRVVAPAPATGNCTPGYSPCLPPSSDYDCSGGSGNGPSYTESVSVDHNHGDPYELDSDGDGVGCERS